MAELEPESALTRRQAVRPLRASDSGLVDIEQLAGLEPELIIGAWLPGDSLVDRYQEVATTALFDLENGDAWDAVADQAVRAVGEQKRGERLRRRYQRRLQRMRHTHAGSLGSLRIAVVDGTREGAFRLLPVDSWGMRPLSMVGLRTIPAQLRQQDPTATLSYELLDVLDAADLVLLGADAAGGLGTGTRALLETPLWQRLEPVRNGRVRRLSNFYLYGYSQADALLDGLEEILREL